MLKKLTVFVVLLSLILVAIPVSAGSYDSPLAVSQIQGVTFEKTITVTKDGGVFEVGFTEITFKKNFIDSDSLPITLDVKIIAKEGKAYIVFTPDVPDFKKDVTIKVNAYNGYLYDPALNQDVYVEVEKQQYKVSHFSRYALS